MPLRVGGRLPIPSIGGIYLGSEGVLFQKSPNTCGPAALRMIFQHFGVETSEEEMERRLVVSGPGSSMLALKKMAESFGFRATGWRLTQYALENCHFPVILFVHQDHFVVADSISSQQIYLRDPAIGRVRIPIKELSRIWKGELLLVEERVKME